MTVRYANDIILTDLARRITNEWTELNAQLTGGQLDGAFKTALKIDTDLEGLMWRLNDIKYGRV